MQNKILQGTSEWLEAKQSKISASEIFSLVLHYCRAELEVMNFNLREEKSFRTVQELFLKVKFDAKLSDIDHIHSEFGQGMEPYVAYRLQCEVDQFEVKRSKEFIVNENLHSLAACSPDGYGRFFDSDCEVEDFDKTCKINEKWGEGAIELKTANYFANFGSEKGARLSYIFQLQFQLMVMGLKWGCLAVLMPKEKEFDEGFFKGQILEKVRRAIEVDEIAATMNHSGTKEYTFESEVNQYYDLKHYIYPELPVFQAMIMKALNAFQADLDGYDTDQSLFPRNSEDLVGLQREKRMWGQLWSEHYGILTLGGEEILEELRIMEMKIIMKVDRTKKPTKISIAEIAQHLMRKKLKLSKKQLDLLFVKSELNRLFNDRYQAQIEKMFAEQAFEKITNEIYQKVKENGFDKYCELIGTENRMTWIKNGQVRFIKIKEAKT